MQSDLFRVDENGVTSDGYRVLDPSCKKSMYVSRIATIAVLTVIVAAVHIYVEGRDTVPDFVGTGILAAFAIFAAWMLISPQIFYRRYRYRLDEDKVDIRKGVVIITHQMVPIERIHQVDVSAGPVNRAFGLADVSITTAGGVVTLQFLEADVAEGIANTLNERIVRMLKDRA